MEDTRQDLRTKFRAATESSGLAGFGLASIGMLFAFVPESTEEANKGSRETGSEGCSGGVGTPEPWRFPCRSAG